MPARINNPRAADQLRREYNVMGDRLNLVLDDVVVPVAVVANLSAGASGIPLVRRCYASFFQAAVAAEYTSWRLETPPNVIIVVSRVFLQGAANGLSRAGFGSNLAVPANTADSRMMDGRQRSQGITPQAVLTYGTQVAGLGGAALRYLQTRTIPGEENFVEYIFGRTDGLYDFLEFQAPAVNQAMTCSLEWDEIPVSP